MKRKILTAITISTVLFSCTENTSKLLEKDYEKNERDQLRNSSSFITNSDDLVSIDPNGSTSSLSQDLIIEVHRDKDLDDDRLYYRVGELDASNTIEWKSIEYYTAGNHPSIGYNGHNIFEVHRDKDTYDDLLYYRYGTLSNDLKISWSNIQFMTAGNQPSVDINNSNNVVEVHRGKTDNDLYFRTGTITSPTSFSWKNISFLTTGKYPDVSINDSNIVVEVHEDKDESDDDMYIWIGELASNGSISWKTKQRYTDGIRPSVSVNNSNIIVEVHQDPDFFDSGMYIWIGRINSDFSITWLSKSRYTDGNEPTVSVKGNKIIEMHRADGGRFSTQMYYRVGEILSNNTVSWKNNVPYTRGRLPSVSF
ncbi:hypothetical protein [Tenacibaculum sp. 190524A05c]|uniref:hypothetical protein n=1 Tax=Tenacibaculum platacis TaxID=3137852 RepID=UPI0032B2F219